MQNNNLTIMVILVKIWEKKKPKSNKLTVVLPLVVYHGKKEWNVSLKLSNEIQDYNKLPKEILKYIPHFETFIIYIMSGRNNLDIEKVKDMVKDISNEWSV